ncbi:MAG: hypothetical protein LBC85_11115 [Fibromonadaceae bacterium]|nr:hypothetical protein [Fibromonadaceae bacterium]
MKQQKTFEHSAIQGIENKVFLNTSKFWGYVARVVFLFIFTPYAGLLTIFSLTLGNPFINFMLGHGLFISVIIFLTSIILGLLYATYKCLKDGANEKVGIHNTEKIYEALFANVLEEISTQTDNANKNIDKYNSGKIYESLAIVLEKSCPDKDYALVLRLGSALSRVLWIAGQYKYRISIGNIIFAAACKHDDSYQKARVQIDDIGWTYFVLKETPKAMENIRNGLLIAQDIKNDYLTAKAYRHLAIIFLSQGNSSILNTEESIEQAEKNIEQAKKAAEKIFDPIGKKEMLAGIDYVYVEILISKKDLENALTVAQKTLDEYTEILDMERKAKSFSQIGKIFLLKNDYKEAIVSFKSGLGIAEKSSRKDEIIKCFMGLAVACYKNDDINEARVHKNTCENYLQKDENFASWDEIISMYSNIPNN